MTIRALRRSRWYGLIRNAIPAFLRTGQHRVNQFVIIDLRFHCYFSGEACTAGGVAIGCVSQLYTASSGLGCGASRFLYFPSGATVSADSLARNFLTPLGKSLLSASTILRVSFSA